MMGDDDPRNREQKALLQKAVERGYFKVPREISLVELSEELRMTDKETFRELNRALDQYLRENLLDDGP